MISILINVSAKIDTNCDIIANNNNIIDNNHPVEKSLHTMIKVNLKKFVVVKQIWRDWAGQTIEEVVHCYPQTEVPARVSIGI